MIFNSGVTWSLLRLMALLTDAKSSHDIENGLNGPFRIFNTVHSTLRLWESALSHNGLSCFKATIPQGVRLYHGSNVKSPVNGLTWLAFDIQHALMFTKTPATKSFATSNTTTYYLPGSASLKNSIDINFGWQHEYATRKALTVLYFDGLSSAKTTMGTLDMQDILLNRGRDAAPINDKIRAQELCALLWGWNTEIDGIIRMEHGLEVILCQAEESLMPLRVSRRRIPESWSTTRSMFVQASELTEYFRTAFARDQIFGQSKAIIDFATMVTGTSHIQSISSGLSRLFDLSPHVLQRIRVEVKDMVQARANPHEQQNWQVVADLIVAQYSDMLQYLANVESAELFVEKLDSVLSPFVEDSDGFPVVNITTCASQCFPAAKEHRPSVAAEALLTVSTNICKTLAHIGELKDGDLAASQIILNDLINRLDWSTWKKKQCGICAQGEFCWTPIWPFGSAAQRAKPSCQCEVAVEFRDRYWR